jgi:restriction endonuclease S subunit
MDEEMENAVKKALKLQEKDQQLKALEKETKALRKELLATLLKNGWKSLDLEEKMKLTLVEYTKESVSQEGIAKIKELLPERDIATVVQTKEFVNSEGIKHLKVLLTETQLAMVVDLSPTQYVKLTDREAK